MPNRRPRLQRAAASPALPAPAHRKLTAEQQRGIRLLKTAEAQATGLPTDDPNCTRGSFCVKGWLQDSILSEILKKNVKEAEELLPGAEASIRAGVTAKLVDYYIGKRNFSRAQELLTRIADQSDYPFEAATKLIKALPKGNSADRLTIFTQAQNNFEQH